MKDKVFLVEPSVLYKEQFFTMLSRYENSDENIYFDMYKEARIGFEQYVDNLLCYARGVRLPEGWLPYHTYWLTNIEEELLGIIRIRISIDNDYLRNYAGHIGYDISPLFRKQGYGNEILRLGLEKVRVLGLVKVLLICNSENEGSRKIIENSGGILESEIFDDNSKELMRRYWIKL